MVTRQIEFVAYRPTGDSELDWFVREHGEGRMFHEREPNAVDAYFLIIRRMMETLVFVSEPLSLH
jgi:hypothetical protein